LYATCDDKERRGEEIRQHPNKNCLLSSRPDLLRFLYTRPLAQPVTCNGFDLWLIEMTALY
jgi:hypothetical protein